MCQMNLPLSNSQKKLRVCHFTYSFFPTIGGLEEMIHNISIAMGSYNCEPYIFAPYVRGENNKLDVPYTVLRYSRPSSRRFGLRQLLIPLLWHHIKYHFDILHCHGVYPPGYVGASFSRFTGIPFVITPHGGDIKTNTHGFIINKRITSLIRQTFQAAHAVTAISSDIKKRVLHLGATPNKTYLIPHGIFSDGFKVSAEHQQTNGNDSRYILYLGRLEKDKGVDVLIKAFSAVKKKHPDIELRIAGEGKEINTLKTLADRLDIGHSVHFLGIIRGENKIQALSKACLLVCPSRSEAFGIVILEAFAAGIPVIASRVGGIPDIIEEKVNGLLVETDSPEQLASKISLLLDDRELRKYLVRNAFIAVSGYEWSFIVKQYINIYSKICEKTCI